MMRVVTRFGCGTYAAGADVDEGLPSRSQLKTIETSDWPRHASEEKRTIQIGD